MRLGALYLVVGSVLMLSWCGLLTVSLQTKQSLYNICTFDNTSLTAADSCQSNPPCEYCVFVLMENSIYRMSDIVVRTGLKWQSDANHILTEAAYRGTFLHQLLIEHPPEDPVSVEENLASLRRIIYSRVDQVLSEQDKSLAYRHRQKEGQQQQETAMITDDDAIDENPTLIVYLRMGDRIDHIPLQTLVNEISVRNVSTVVLSFVLHFGSWSSADLAAVTDPDLADLKFEETYHYSAMANSDNYEYVWNVIQYIYRSFPAVNVVIRSNADQDQDLALYVTSTNFVECACGGFERLVKNLRNSNSGILESQTVAQLARNGISRNLIQYVLPQGRSARTGSSLQRAILKAFGRVFFGFNGVTYGIVNATGQWKRSRMGLAAAGRRHGNHMVITSTTSVDVVREIVELHAPQNTTVFVPRVNGRSQSLAVAQNLTFAVLPQWKTDFNQETVSLVYIQSWKDVMKEGIKREVWKYATEVFGMSGDAIGSDKLVAGIQQWVELWYLSRTCCSKRDMDSSWRAALKSLHGAKVSSLPAGTHLCQNFSDMRQEEVSMAEIEVDLWQQRTTVPGTCERAQQALADSQ